VEVHHEPTKLRRLGAEHVAMYAVYYRQLLRVNSRCTGSFSLSAGP
jgi:hypothetical protein